MQRLRLRSGPSNRPDSKQAILRADHLGMPAADLQPTAATVAYQDWIKPSEASFGAASRRT
jgi:hypothetical protein